MAAKIVYPDADPAMGELLQRSFGERLHRLGEFAIHYGRPGTHQEFVERIGDASAIILGWNLPIRVLADAPSLEIISFTGIGAGTYVDLEEAERRGITVCNTPGYADEAVAEHALALLLAVAHKVTRWDREVRRGRWDSASTYTGLAGKTLGLIGYGGIGARMGQLASALDMQVLAWTPHPESHPEVQQQHVDLVPLDDLLIQADVVSLHLALTPGTRGLIDASRFARMKKGVIVINTARGGLIDEQALCEALHSGAVAGAGLDVFAQEPIASDNPLCSLDGVVLTPHAAFRSPAATGKLLDIAVANLECYFAGRPQNMVTAE